MNDAHAALAAQQDALLHALLLQRHDEAIRHLQPAHVAGAPAACQRGLIAYRSNAAELAERALAGAYPVTLQLLGDENFAAIARELWRAQPPERGDLAHWGAGLAAHLEALPDLAAEEPYLADVARAEWLLHLAATAADRSLDASSFALLAEGDPSEVTLVLAPGTACVASRHAIASVLTAHLDGEPALPEAGQRLVRGLAETALVWRQGLRPRVRAAARGEAIFIAALQDRRSLADSLEAAPHFDFNEWLTPAAHSGLLLGAAPMIDLPTE